MDNYKQVLDLLNSGEWFLAPGRLPVVSAELQSDHLLIKTEDDLTVIKVFLEEGQILIYGDPCLEICILGNSELVSRTAGPFGLNAQTFRHKKRWYDACYKKTAELIGEQVKRFIGKTAVAMENYEGQFELDFDDGLMIAAEWDRDTGDLGICFGNLWIPRTRGEFRRLGEEALEKELEPSISAHLKAFYGKKG
jgi:hypothetical protein